VLDTGFGYPSGAAPKKKAKARVKHGPTNSPYAAQLQQAPSGLRMGLGMDVSTLLEVEAFLLPGTPPNR